MVQWKNASPDLPETLRKGLSQIPAYKRESLRTVLWEYMRNTPLLANGTTVAEKGTKVFLTHG